MGLLLVIVIMAIMIVITTVIIMWSAQKCGAENNSFGACLAVSILGAIVNIPIDKLIKDDFASMVISWLLFIFIMMAILKTKFIQSMIISLIATVINFLTILIIGGSLFVAMS